MFIDYKLEGIHTNLRSVKEDDAEKILKLRNDPRITDFLPPLDVTVEQQRQWITKQRSDKSSYYFIIEDKLGNCLGTVGFYDIEGDHAETGRYCCIGEVQHSVEATILQSDFIYDVVRLSYLTSWVYDDNKPVVSLTKNYGFECVGVSQADDGRSCCLFKQTREQYFKKREKIVTNFLFLLIIIT